MRYSSIRFVLVPLGDGWVGGNIRSVLHTKVHYISTTSNLLTEGLYSQGHYIIAGSNGIVSYFIGQVLSGQGGVSVGYIILLFDHERYLNGLYFIGLLSCTNVGSDK